MQFASNPTWLDRLRRSKGFPSNSVDDLDNFLSLQNTPKTPIPQNPKPNPSSPKQDLTSVLFDLFNFGESNDDPVIFSKKGVRKQKMPRFCVVLEKRENEAVTRVMREESGDFGERESFDGYSRTNVTVIDTSCAWWKCERVVFRKKNLWRVRDRKSKATNNIEGKKRRSRVLEGENYGTRKKSKVFGLSEEGNTQNETTSTSIEESDDTFNQFQNQNHRFPRKSKKSGTSDGVLIKKTLTSKPLKTDGS